jgi:hypothetical protein
MLLLLAWSSSLPEAHAQQKAGLWITITPKARYDSIAVAKDSVLRRMSDSLRIIRDRLAMMDRLKGDGLRDYLAYWVDDSTLSLSIPIDSLARMMNRSEGRRDSSWFGGYDLVSQAWTFPGYIDEPPYPAWYTRDWSRWHKTGVYVNPTSPLQLEWHIEGDTAAVFELKLPRARLLQYLGIDSTQSTVGPKLRGVVYADSGSNWSTFQTLNLNDSTRSFRMIAGPGVRFTPMWSSASKDTLLLGLDLDYDVLWLWIKDSVLAYVGGGGGGSSTFAGLTDTPSNYTGNAGKFVTVKPDESGLEFSGLDAQHQVVVTDTLQMAYVVRDTLATRDQNDTLAIWYDEISPPLTHRFSNGIAAVDALGYVQVHMVSTGNTSTGGYVVGVTGQIVADTAHGVSLRGLYVEQFGFANDGSGMGWSRVFNGLYGQTPALQYSDNVGSTGYYMKVNVKSQPGTSTWASKAVEVSLVNNASLPTAQAQHAWVTMRVYYSTPRGIGVSRPVSFIGW